MVITPWLTDFFFPVIHGSDSADSAQKEIALWFNDKEVASYESNRDKWVHEK